MKPTRTDVRRWLQWIGVGAVLYVAWTLWSDLHMHIRFWTNRLTPLRDLAGAMAVVGVAATVLAFGTAVLLALMKRPVSQTVTAWTAGVLLTTFATAWLLGVLGEVSGERDLDAGPVEGAPCGDGYAWKAYMPGSPVADLSCEPVDDKR